MTRFTYQDCNHAPIESKPFCLYHLHLRSASLKCKNATSFADIYKIMPRIADVYNTRLAKITNTDKINSIYVIILTEIRFP